FVDLRHVRGDLFDVALVLRTDKARDDSVYYLLDIHVSGLDVPQSAFVGIRSRTIHCSRSQALVQKTFAVANAKGPLSIRVPARPMALEMVLAHSSNARTGLRDAPPKIK
ncbi:MAG TPA: hypothetical protein VFS68_03545, partial [Candidatus Udaeobacter sp.]|nr:hypothetical protein [Candidatus Udaeobacter sp.]